MRTSAALGLLPEGGVDVGFGLHATLAIVSRIETG